MDKEVVVESPLLDELLVAHVALVGFVSCVHKQVFLQGAFIGVLFVA